MGFSQIRFYSFHIPILDKMAREISDALLLVAFSVDWILVAKKYVLSAKETLTNFEQLIRSLPLNHYICLFNYKLLKYSHKLSA